MSKLEGSSALTRRKEKSRLDKITTVGSRRNVTTGTSPTPIRLTPDERAELNLWVEELQQQTQKKLTAAKLMRGLIHMRKSINTGKLIEAIKDIT
ncbi:hypothetical protein WH06_22780 [Aeromonas salmonicida subsp. salmonicida]|uniref:Uncharacterized protein n=3 Tax=Aeromonas salmonicida subsp. salmonicida TaxID=29491 RepID=A0A1Q4MD26_AERSS|nr:hypothetical protein [Aeromonas salmonicida]ABO92590.1 conserved hypothetical protein [Aeromonas salmonicida subsp. salmonicida A449]ASD49312.1 hypothetical protein [Aeromonas salmonicida subsp. salmonicida]EHI50302.1 hypothetical protein IYQ_22410 [Aeromonas salmonicida subsp. salmonicida 01-B526]EKP0241287.1 hypothetical protein [Aeromonas salmonicida]EKP0245431.1 hypothetical protein [Aeromonas salmonicida]